MRRAFFASSTAALLLAPMIASAAFQLPKDLFTSLQSSLHARSFSFEAHGGSNGTYVSFWSKGKQSSTSDDMKLTMNATIDVVEDGMRVRFKADIIATDGQMYLKLKSVEGNHKAAIPPFVDIAKQNQWIEIAADNDMLTDVTGTDIGMLSAVSPMEADEMFTMISVSGPKGSTYTLTLTSDFAATMAQKLRQMLGDTEPVSTDFFPWRELAESMRFEMTISTDAASSFENSAFSMSMSGKNSYFKANGTEKALGSGLTIKAPEGAIAIGDIILSFGNMNFGELPTGPAPASIMQSSSMMMQDEDMDADEAAADASQCTNGSISAQQLMMLQRTGACPTLRVPTRYTR